MENSNVNAERVLGVAMEHLWQNILTGFTVGPVALQILSQLKEKKNQNKR
jgi:hypothetical protein